MKIDFWERSFFNFIQAAETRPFFWGEFDCCLFAADAIQAVTGQDPAVAIRSTYSDEAGAVVKVAEFGGLAEMAIALFQPMGAVEVPALFAKRGDVVRLVMPGLNSSFGECGAVCIGRDVAFLTDVGLRTISLKIAAEKLDARVWSFD